MKQHFDVPMAWTTDVNAAAYGEYVAGNGQHTSSCVYYTIGTGVGAGAIQNGEFIEGFSHPEMGHALVRRHPEDTYAGNCPYPVSYTHLRAHETGRNLVCRLLLEKNFFNDTATTEIYT